jgi:hypothetical protein
MSLTSQNSVLFVFKNQTPYTLSRSLPRLKTTCYSILEAIRVGSLVDFERIPWPYKSKIFLAVKHKFIPYLSKHQHMPFEIHCTVRYACQVQDFELAKQFYIQGVHDDSVCKGVLYSRIHKNVTPRKETQGDNIIRKEEQVFIRDLLKTHFPHVPTGRYEKMMNVHDNVGMRITIGDVYENIQILRASIMYCRDDMFETYLKRCILLDKDIMRLVYLVYRTRRHDLLSTITNRFTHRTILPIACITGNVDLLEQVEDYENITYAFKLACRSNSTLILHYLTDKIKENWYSKYSNGCNQGNNCDDGNVVNCFKYAIQWAQYNVAVRFLNEFGVNDRNLYDFFVFAMKYNFKPMLMLLISRFPHSLLFTCACNAGNVQVLREHVDLAKAVQECLESNSNAIQNILVKVIEAQHYHTLKWLFHQEMIYGKLDKDIINILFYSATCKSDVRLAQFLVKHLEPSNNIEQNTRYCILLCKQRDTTRVQFYLEHVTVDVKGVLDELIYEPNGTVHWFLEQGDWKQYGENIAHLLTLCKDYDGDKAIDRCVNYMKQFKMDKIKAQGIINALKHNGYKGSNVAIPE